MMMNKAEKQQLINAEHNYKEAVELMRNKEKDLAATKQVATTNMQLSAKLRDDLDETKKELDEANRKVASLQGYIDRVQEEEFRDFTVNNPMMQVPREPPIARGPVDRYFRDDPNIHYSSPFTHSERSEPRKPWYLR